MQSAGGSLPQQDGSSLSAHVAVGVRCLWSASAGWQGDGCNMRVPLSVNGPERARAADNIMSKTLPAAPAKGRA